MAAFVARIAKLSLLWALYSIRDTFAFYHSRSERYVFKGVCSQGARGLPSGGICLLKPGSAPPREAENQGIRSMRERYASYWNVYLLKVRSHLQFIRRELLPELFSLFAK